jgi:hypothetical protein
MESTLQPISIHAMVLSEWRSISKICSYRFKSPPRAALPTRGQNISQSHDGVAQLRSPAELSAAF